MEENLFLKSTHKVYEGEDELTVEDRELIEKAQEACKSSYSPYSNFEVGAAVLLETGEIIMGSNQENSAYPSGLCAERVALYHASSNHGQKIIKKIAVTAKRAGTEIFLPVTPCGGCRQVMLEYEVKQNMPIEVIMKIAENKWVKIHSTEVLLPFCFNKNSL